MQQTDEAENRIASRRLRCVQQVTEADEETLQIVSAVLDRSVPTKSERKKRGRSPRSESEKGGNA